MTVAHSIAQPSEPKVLSSNNRQLTVSYASRYPDYSRMPAITMKGQWLEAAGFATGTVVDVKVMKGCIVLTALQESELMQSLRQVCKLSARKQKQVQEFIKVITGKQQTL